MGDFDYGGFWSFGDNWERGAVRVKWAEWPPDLSKGNGRLGFAKDVTRGRLVPDQAVRFTQDEGRRWCDWIGTNFLFSVVSDAFVRVLREQAASGWSLYDVAIVARDGSPVRGYHGFAITSEAAAAWQMSQPTIQPPKVPAGPSYVAWKGLYFDPATWDGADIFLVAGQRVCTRRVADALQEAGVTNVGFERVTEWLREWEAR